MALIYYSTGFVLGGMLFNLESVKSLRDENEDFGYQR